MSVHLDMNTKSKRTRLIVEFKECQRLPDWPITKLIDPNQTSENPSEQKVSLSRSVVSLHPPPKPSRNDPQTSGWQFAFKNNSDEAPPLGEFSIGQPAEPS